MPFNFYNYLLDEQIGLDNFVIEAEIKNASYSTNYNKYKLTTLKILL